MKSNVFRLVGPRPLVAVAFAAAAAAAAGGSAEVYQGIRLAIQMLAANLRQITTMLDLKLPAMVFGPY